MYVHTYFVVITPFTYSLVPCEKKFFFLFFSIFFKYFGEVSPSFLARLCRARAKAGAGANRGQTGGEGEDRGRGCVTTQGKKKANQKKANNGVFQYIALHYFVHKIKLS